MKVRRLLLAASVAFLLLQAIAFMQARAMTHFSSDGLRTKPPEALGHLEAASVILSGVRIPRPENDTTPATLGMPYETLTIPKGPNAFVEVWHVPGIRGPLVLAFPGYATSKEDILPAAKLLHDFGYDVLLVDFTGVGGSSGSVTTLSHEEARDAALVLRYARSRWPDRILVLYGTSMGGAAVLRAVAREEARPDGIIIESTFDTLLNTTRNRFRAMGLPASPFAELLLFWGGIQQGVNCFSLNPVDDARDVTCPVLVLHAEDDQRVMAAEAERLHRALRGSEFHAYAGVGHTLIASEQPQPWVRDVDSFLRSLSPTTSSNQGH